MTILNNRRIKTLQFAAKEREKWSKEGYFDYEKALDKLYKINPNGYAQFKSGMETSLQI